MKRFAWLWGALLGVSLFSVLMGACGYGLATNLPVPKGFPASNLTFLSLLSIMAKRYGICGGVLGCCGAMLWMENRSLLWRSLSTFASVATGGYLSWEFWSYWPSLTTGFADWNRWNRLVIAVTYAPLLLGVLLLLFFALITRSSRSLAV